MSNAKEGSNVLLGVLKAVIVAAMKTVALVIAFACKILSITLDKTAAVLQKLAGHGTHH